MIDLLIKQEDVENELMDLVEESRLGTMMSFVGEWACEGRSCRHELGKTILALHITSTSYQVAGTFGEVDDQEGWKVEG